MAHPPSPDHAADIPEVEPVQPEIAPAAPELAPPSPNNVFNFLNGNPKAENPEEEEDPEEDPKEEPEEEPEEQEQEEMEKDDEMDDPELIFPYEASGSPCPPLLELDTPSNSEPKDETDATVGTIIQLSFTGRRFPNSIHVRGESSSAAPVAYDLEDLVQSYIRRDIASLDGRVPVLARQIGTREAEEALIKNVVVTLEDRVRKMEQYGVGEENQRLKKKLKSKEMSETFLRLDQDRAERYFYEMRAWAYGFYQEMIRVGAVREERPSEAVDVLATFGETPPSEP
ncbi:hypothetical protein Tco_1017963 [Tanacetum coccineum]|uniref:Uncharacterized protein n=1 Tax=Tanacetum coccineum TaxID=301880 RepID=A0ABQ5FUB8_9ASTR